MEKVRYQLQTGPGDPETAAVSQTGPLTLIFWLQAALPLARFIFLGCLKLSESAVKCALSDSARLAFGWLSDAVVVRVRLIAASWKHIENRTRFPALKWQQLSLIPSSCQLLLNA